MSMSRRLAFRSRCAAAAPGPTLYPTDCLRRARLFNAQPRTTIIPSLSAGAQGWSSWPCSCSARRLSTPLVARHAPPPVARRVMSLPGKQPALSCRHRLQSAATDAIAPTAFAAAQLHRHHPRNHPRHRHRRLHHLSRHHRRRHLPIRLCRQCRRGSS